jgi:hypothetical protein
MTAIRRLLPVLLLALGGCGGVGTGASGTTIVPSSTTSAVAASSPAGTEAARATIDPTLCELAIDAGDAFDASYLKFIQAYAEDDAETMDQIVDDTVEVARSLIARIPEDSSLFSLSNFRKKLGELSDSRLKYLTGDPEPFTDALSAAAVVGLTFRTACRGVG